jgi:hypothetical protein
MLFTHHLPELGTDLVPALPSLDVQNLTHLGKPNPTQLAETKLDEAKHRQRRRNAAR